MDAERTKCIERPLSTSLRANSLQATPRRPAPRHRAPQRRPRPSPATNPRRERQQSPASPAREILRSAAPVPEAVTAGQHDALAAAPVRACEHDPLPGLYASVSHAPSVAPGARPFTVNRPEVDRGSASREPAPQVRGTCARGTGFRLQGVGTLPCGGTVLRVRLATESS